MFENLPSVSPLLIPILALLIPFVAIAAHHLGKAHSERQRHETMRELVRAGQPIPPELLAGLADSEAPAGRREPPNPNRLLLAGVINVSAGLGLMGMFAAMMPGAWLWAIGLLPLCFGLGLTLLWLVERQQSPKP